MLNALRLIFGNIQIVFFAGVFLYELLRRSSLLRRFWRWFWA